MSIAALGALAIIYCVTHGEEAHRGPQCTIAYPRGFEFSRAVPEDGPSCGTIAVSWRACVPSWQI